MKENQRISKRSSHTPNMETSGVDLLSLHILLTHVEKPARVVSQFSGYPNTCRETREWSPQLCTPHHTGNHGVALPKLSRISNTCGRNQRGGSLPAFLHLTHVEKPAGEILQTFVYFSEAVVSRSYVAKKIEPYCNLPDPMTIRKYLGRESNSKIQKK
ncbi:hypothetical protein AVEN_34477-1 [Araneus ventricosus]|uniref:Uncharacterized protein n=1 Tax=Araneus ventricosus TaxID=182803 RepID=A0A4Y2RAD3_ARAVE|nr:hypothetical protein AVEN_34477-1 [Araneus ventricosus]